MKYGRSLIILLLLLSTFPRESLNSVLMSCYTFRGIDNANFFISKNAENFHICTVLTTWFGLGVSGVFMAIHRFEYLGHVFWLTMFFLQYMGFVYDKFINGIENDATEYRKNKSIIVENIEYVDDS